MTDLKKLLKNAENDLLLSDSPKNDAFEIASLVFGLSRTDILLCPVRELPGVALNRFDELIKKRAGGYPLQYILGEWDFFGFTFYVTEGVLIPRPETEQIADKACAFLKNKKNAVVFDICAGSGCIGLSVAANNPDSSVFLFDISEQALACEERNRNRHSLDNVTILDYDIFSGFSGSLPEPDVILCNPPYVTREEYRMLETSIFFEPETAIVADGDGLDFYRCLAGKWLPYLKKDGFFMFESGEGQPEKIMRILGGKFRAVCENDMYGVCRFVRSL